MRQTIRYAIIIFSSVILASCCKYKSFHHEIHGDIKLKDHIYVNISVDFIVDTKEALHEVSMKQDQLRFALTLALREHPSTELEGRGKRAVYNALKSIARQVLTHPVKEVRITGYTFHEQT